VAAVSPSAMAAMDPPKPEWPQQFDSPFGLFDLQPLSPVVNANAHFYYHYDTSGSAPLQAQRISYPVQCIPLATNGSNSPCDLYFFNGNNTGLYLAQPGIGKDCCLAIPDLGPIPPAFLGGFTWNSVQIAPDLSGTRHNSNYWAGSGFGYWTDLQTGDDVFFQDGGSGIYWAWGDFNVQPQPASVFALPANPAECNTLCILTDDERAAIANDPDVRRAWAHLHNLGKWAANSRAAAARP